MSRSANKTEKAHPVVALRGTELEWHPSPKNGLMHIYGEWQ